MNDVLTRWLVFFGIMVWGFWKHRRWLKNYWEDFKIMFKAALNQKKK